MKTFEYVSAQSGKDAVAILENDFNKVKVIAGGMDLVSELKQHLVEVEKLVGIGALSEMHYIRKDGGAFQIGATTTLSEITDHPDIRQSHTALAEAAGQVGSPQIRNMGTLGGNLCQRPRCWYYRDENYPCLKKGGAICYSLTGRNKYNAIFGGGPSYIVHPSDCATALVALGATVHILGPDGERSLPIDDFFTLPTEILTRENRLAANEIVTRVDLPATSGKSTYVKFREKDSYDWALSAVAVVLELDGASCKKASIVLGGVAPKPWRAAHAEKVLQGQAITETLAAKAGEAALEGAEAMSDNGYKIPLTRNLVKHAILHLAGMG